MYRVIMVPVDGSPFSREAVFQGLRMAKATGAQLRLVRVGWVPAIISGADQVALDNVAWEKGRDDMLAQLYHLAAECRASADVDVTATLEDGPIADALRGHALRHGVDLIVMATHGRRGLARIWLGSVADRLIRETGIPVLVVRPPSLATELASGFCFKRIIVPLDGSPLAERSLEAAIDLAEFEQATVTLLRVVKTDDHVPPGELYSSRGAASATDVEDAEQYLARWKFALAGRNVPIEWEVVIATDIPSAILRLAEQNNADLIALATHGRGGIARALIGSVADRLVSEGMLSILVVHPAGSSAEFAARGVQWKIQQSQIPGGLLVAEQ
jgi:nucleotide-binding universal stress UspA family protein